MNLPDNSDSNPEKIVRVVGTQQPPPDRDFSRRELITFQVFAQIFVQKLREGAELANGLVLALTTTISASRSIITSTNMVTGFCTSVPKRFMVKTGSHGIRPLRWWGSNRESANVRPDRAVR